MRNTVRPLPTSMTLALLLALQAGCTFNTAVKQDAAHANLPAGNTSHTPQVAITVLSGKVLETMDAGGYTYLSLEKDGKKSWAAIPTTPVKVGDEVALQSGAEMKNFSSKSLNRSFDSIIFSNGLAQNAEAIQAPAQATPAALSGKVVEAMDAAGYTYLNLEKNGKRVWAAIPTTSVKVGDEVALQNGAEMKNFSSKALNRSFDSIIFSNGLAEDAAQATSQAPAQAPAHAAAPAAPQKMIAVKETDTVMAGKVIEVLSAGNYTYICLENDGKKGWNAIPATDVKVGDQVEVQEGTPMGAFSSRTLQRSFANIVFSQGITKK